MILLKFLKPSNLILIITIGFVIFGFPLFYKELSFYIAIIVMSCLVFSYILVLKKLKISEEKAKLTEAKLATLQNISTPLNSTLNLDEALEIIVQSCSQLIPATFSLIELIDKEREVLIPKAIAGRNIKLIEIATSKEDFSNQVIEKRAICFISDLDDVRNLPKWAKSQRFKAYLGIPIFRADDIIGVISLYFQNPYPLSEEEKDLISIFVSHVGSAIENAELYSLTKESLSKEMESSIMLYRIEHSIASGNLLDDQLKLIIAGASDVTAAGRASLWLLDEISSELTCKICYPPINKAEGTIGDITPVIILGEGITGWIAKSGQPANIPDVSQDARFSNLWEERVVSMLGVPLKYKGKTIGVLEVYNRLGEIPFNEDDERILTALANQAAVAVGSSWLYEKMKNSAMALASLYEVAKSVSQGRDVHDTLSLILDKAIHVFQAQNGSIMLVDKASDTGQMSIKIAKGLSKEIIANTVVNAGDGTIAGWVAKEKKPILLIGKVEDSRFKSVRDKIDIKDAMSAPLLAKNRLIGVFNISNKNGEGHFTQTDLNLLCTFAHESAVVLETTRVYRETEQKIMSMERQLEVITRLKEIAEKTAPLSMEIEEMLSVALNLTMELVKTEVGIVLLEENGEFKVKVANVSKTTNVKPKTDEGFLRKMYHFKKGEEIIHWIVENKKPLLINNFEEDDRFKKHITPFRITNLLAVPITVNNEIKGVIELMNKNQPFITEDLNIVSALSEQLSSSIDKANTFEDMNRKVLGLTTVQAITRMVGDSLSVEEILQRLSELISKMMHSDKAWILFLDKDSEKLTMKASFGMKAAERLIEDNIAIGWGISGHVAAQNEPLLIKNIKEDTHLDESEKKIYHQNTSYLSVPLLISGKIIGILSISRENRNGLHYDENDLQILMTIAENISLVIESNMLHDELQNRNRETIKTLALIIEARDPFTKGHSDTVAKYAVAIGAEMSLPAEELKTLYCAGLLHDIGKIGVREDLLLKKERELGDNEYQEIKNHPVTSTNILKSLSFLQPILPIIYHHHERFEGGGYVDGIAGEKIPLGARILAVADAFDAMTSDRAFRESKTDEQALNELKEQAGKQFDPKVITAFLKVFPQLKKEKGTDAIEKK